LDLFDDKYNVLLVLDSIYCTSCVNFHIEEIQKLRVNNVIVYSPDNFEYVKSYIKNAIEIKNSNVQNTKELLSDKLAVSLVSQSGLLLYYEISDKENYFKSKMFYEKLQTFLKNSDSY